MMPWKYWMSALLTAATVAITATPASAGWQNTFQVTCFRRKPTVVQYTPSIAYYAPVVEANCCAPPPPQQVCTTRYVQRSYYQPVTTYQSRSYYEPVTTYQTSYYYEPTTSYRYSSYYDPCSCSYKMVGSPVTTYHLKQQVCPVQSFVQRTMMVPVTTYRIATYYEPQTCCTQVAAAPPPCCGSTPGPSVAAPAPTVTEGTNTNPPSVQEQRQPADTNSPLYNSNKPNSQQMPQAPTGGNNATGYRPSLPPIKAPVNPNRSINSPRLDKIAADFNWQPAQSAKAELARRITIVDDE